MALSDQMTKFRFLKLEQLDKQSEPKLVLIKTCYSLNPCGRTYTRMRTFPLVKGIASFCSSTTRPPKLPDLSTFDCTGFQFNYATQHSQAQNVGWETPTAAFCRVFASTDPKENILSEDTKEGDCMATQAQWEYVAKWAGVRANVVWVVWCSHISEHQTQQLKPCLFLTEYFLTFCCRSRCRQIAFFSPLGTWTTISIFPPSRCLRLTLQAVSKPPALRAQRNLFLCLRC